MRKKTWIAMLLLPALLLAVCAPLAAAEDTLHVIQVKDLPEDFILGMDLSSLLAEERSGVRYFDFDGREKDLLQIMADNGITHIRVRVWNDPYDEQGRGFGGGNCDIGTALEIGKRASQFGLKLIVDFHYSDFWADPGKYKAPRAWEGLDASAKAQALYAYTRESLETLRDADVDVGMVQIGNEINNGLAGETDWNAILPMLAAGARAVREVCPEALVAVHFTEPHNRGLYSYYADLLRDYGLDYDVFGSSYYPFWHGTLENLSEVLTEINRNYGKQVMVLETSWPYTGEDTDFSGNSVNEDSWGTRDYPFTVQGQADAVRDVIDTVAHIPGGIGICYWEGAWITVGGASWEENSAKWEEFGSGWASSFAAVYDPDDAGRWYGGSSWDNQAFFDASGHPLASLRLFSLLRSGSGDQSRRETAPAPEEQPAEDLPNLLENGSFESGELSPWILIDRCRGGELFVEDKAVDSLEGSWHMHFWNPNRDSVDFDLEQTVEDLPEGSYVYSVSIMGGDCGETEIFAYVKVNGELRFTEPMRVTVWNSWDTAVIPQIALSAGETLTVGVSVKCQGAGNGAWGKIDCAALRAED
ncbi:MAG: glycosyl hydrolase 53 family protein [Oscillospiraceae bacterium]|nr:glycosyl hydrolase 53 family protein [Oscillospiraceae bacterium]